MQNFVNPGKTLELTAPTGGVVSGTPYKIGVIVGIAGNTIAETLPFPLAVEGVFDVPKASGTAWAEGDALYWDDVAKNFTKTSTSNTLAGYCVLAALSGDTTGRIRLCPAA